MKHNSTICSKGFTLTEVLLAVMIIGLIGVALASLTRSSAREGGVGRSRIMLRNNSAIFLRTLRRDINQATVIDSLGGYLGAGDVCNYPCTTLLKLKKGVDAQAAMPRVRTTAENTLVKLPQVFVTYCFEAGTDDSNIVPSNANRGGIIYRVEKSGAGANYVNCGEISDMISKGGVVTPVLDHVKFIPWGTELSVEGSGWNSLPYTVPLFIRNNRWGNYGDNRHIINVRIITELNSNPIVNDFIEETFIAPLGY